jgi:DnaK suppressor protein
MKAMDHEHYRGVLVARNTELAELLRNRTVIEVESSADLTDQIQHAAERDMAIGHLERESARIREVRAALHRLDTGTYGICLDCDQEISLRRLAALPWTAVCIRCQEGADHRDPSLNS